MSEAREKIWVCPEYGEYSDGPARHFNIKYIRSDIAEQEKAALRAEIDQYADELLEAKEATDAVTADLEQQLAAKDKEIDRLKKLYLACCRKHSHDHEYWHDDCRMCQDDKERYEKHEQALAGGKEADND